MMTRKNVCRILACQVDVPETLTAADKFEHIHGMLSRIQLRIEQCRSPIDIVVLPELSTISYSREAFNVLPLLAEPLDGESVRLFANWARTNGVAVCFGMPREGPSGYSIAQVTLDAGGNVIGCYDKLHVCQYGASMEKEFFRRGDQLCVFEINGYRFATIICYDIRIPELPRTLVLDHKVDCLLHCGAYFRDESFPTWKSFVITRALENQVYLLSLNRAGAQYGQSMFCPPWIDDGSDPGRKMADFEPEAECFVELEIQTSQIRDIRTAYTFLEDKLPDYHSLKCFQP